MENLDKAECMVMVNGFQEIKINILVSLLLTVKKVGEYINGIMDQSLKVTSLRDVESYNLKGKEWCLQRLNQIEFKGQQLHENNWSFFLNQIPVDLVASISSLVPENKIAI